MSEFSFTKAMSSSTKAKARAVTVSAAP